MGKYAWGFLCGVLAGLWISGAKADVITEFGMGYKLENTTSVLLNPECHIAQVIETRPDHPELNYRYASCGGDNPAFIGWPIAWQKEFSGGIWMVRAGYFHYSNWFDGKKDRETHMDLAAVTATFNWTEWRRGKTSSNR